MPRPAPPRPAPHRHAPPRRHAQPDCRGQYLTPLTPFFRYTPVSIHINYHPEKPDRMKDVHRFYYEKYDTPEKGIWRWNGGEGTKLLTECRAAWPKCPGSQRPMRPPTAPEGPHSFAQCH